MTEETIETEEATETEAPVENEQKIMCFVSKQMVPTSQTIEVEYAPRKRVHVLPRYVKYTDQVEA